MKERKVNENYIKILEIIKLLQTQYHSLAKEVEHLQIKYRKKMQIPKETDDIMEDKPGDQFDSIRKSRKLAGEAPKFGL